MRVRPEGTEGTDPAVSSQRTAPFSERRRRGPAARRREARADGAPPSGRARRPGQRGCRPGGCRPEGHGGRPSHVTAGPTARAHAMRKGHAAQSGEPNARRRVTR
ncbi:hypothetical protein C0216_08265 [Streptomyces globosus]|uniref:Uncharacterized protein n=1 Tax=Streptomyces globosus TaxID=68209 RepID=A0A344TXU0_9ACTN|nr:hypothetical protein C0216_08265 [Streptomyces globosus]